MKYCNGICAKMSSGYQLWYWRILYYLGWLFHSFHITLLIPGGNTDTHMTLVLTMLAWPLDRCLVIGMCAAYKRHSLKFVLEC